MPGPEDFDRVGSLLGDFCETAATPASPGEQRIDEHRSIGSDVRVTTGDPARALAGVWPAIVGAEVAANASPVQLKAGRLVVSTSSSVWAHTLQYMSTDLAARLNERLGDGVVRQIVFRHAGWEERPPGETVDRSRAVAKEAAPLSSEQQQAIDDLQGLDLPPSVREHMERAMRASFVRTQRDSVR